MLLLVDGYNLLHVSGIFAPAGTPPTLQQSRLALLESRGRSVPTAEKLRQRELNLTRLNLICGVVVLGLTAIARVL